MELSGFTLNRQSNLRLDSLPAGIASQTERNSEGNAGRIFINAGSLVIDDAGTITSRTAGRGNGGNIRIHVDDAIALNRDSGITSSVASGGRGNAGDIQIQSRSLTLRNGSLIEAFVARENASALPTAVSGGNGRGGNVRVDALDFVNVSGFSTRQLNVTDVFNPNITSLTAGYSSGIFTLTERGASGAAGNIIVNTENFRIAEGAVIIASTANRSNAGDVTINARNFTAVDGGQLITTTRDRGRAGNITLNIRENTNLTGVDSNRTTRRNQVEQILREPGQTDRVSDVILNQGTSSGIFANTAANSRGTGGTITLNTTNLNLSNRAQISAQSQGQRNAGNIIANVSDRLHVTNSNIITEATRSSGGNIAINTTDNGITILENSDITTNSRSNGGNITIQGGGTIAFGDSDILARSTTASGGEVRLGAFFSQTNNPFDVRQSADGNQQVDVNAQGRQASGAIVTTDTSFVQNSLSNLSDNSINTDRLLSNSCITRDRRRQTQRGQFRVTGSGGLPERPSNAITSTYETGTVQAIPTVDRPATSTTDRPWQMGDAIVEPQDVYRLPDGRLIMSRECPE